MPLIIYFIKFISGQEHDASCFPYLLVFIIYIESEKYHSAQIDFQPNIIIYLVSNWNILKQLNKDEGKFMCYNQFQTPGTTLCLLVFQEIRFCFGIGIDV